MSPIAPASSAFPFDSQFARALPELCVPWQPQAAPAPRLLQLNRALAQELGLDVDLLASSAGLAVLAGQAVPAGARPVAQAMCA